MAALVFQKLLVHKLQAPRFSGLKPLDLMFAAVKQLAETALSFQSLPGQPFAA